MQADFEIFEYPTISIENSAPKIEHNTLNYLIQNFMQSGVKLLFPGRYGAVTLIHTLYNFNGIYVLEGEIIGLGSWAVVYICRQYHIDSDHSIVCDKKLYVIKKPKIGTFLETSLNSFVNIKRKMIMEAKILGGLCLEINDLVTVEKLEYAGESLTAFFATTDPLLLNAISLPQWLSAIINMAMHLQYIHQELDLIHGDIKPDNICILMRVYRELSLTNKNHADNYNYSVDIKLSLIDWASAHKIGTYDAPGDFKYQPYESFCFFSSLKNPKTDVFSLGKTIAEIFSKINKHNNTQETLVACTILSNQMEALFQTSRPTLQDVIKVLIDIKLQCDIAQLSHQQCHSKLICR